jgi:hypothetical protein
MSAIHEVYWRRTGCTHCGQVQVLGYRKCTLKQCGIAMPSFELLYSASSFLELCYAAPPSAQPTIPSNHAPIHPTTHPANRRTILPSIHPTPEDCNRRTQDPSTNHTIDPSNRGPRLPSDQTLDTTTRSTVPLTLQRRNISSVDYQRLLYI